MKTSPPWTLPVERHIYDYPDGRIEIIRDLSPIPYRFAVTHAGRTLVFAGIPNHCYTLRSALTRAHYRLTWLRLGTFDQHYH